MDTIPQLFQAQVERTPDAIAVVFEQQQLTYRELDTKANQLAHYLQGLGVELETLVGICVERSLETAIGLLGILKAGAAYHAATFMNLAYPYASMKAANVGGTQEILRLASQVKLKSVHFVSTPAVFKSTGYLNKPVIHEDDPLEACEVVYGGYGQSKWVAEKLLQIASARGIPISIYRPATISGHSKTGASNPDQTLGRFPCHRSLSN